MRKKDMIRKTSIDDGGPIFISEPDDTSQYQKGLLIDGSGCDNPECDCRDVHLKIIPVDENLPPFIKINKNDSLLGIKEYENFISADQYISAVLNIDNGEITYNGKSPIQAYESDLLESMETRLIKENNLLAVFKRRWRIAKKINWDSYKRKDWSWWEPGSLVSWYEAFPDDWDFLIRENGQHIYLDDQYCVTPGCKCKDAALSFYATTDKKKSDLLGTLFINLKKISVDSVASTSIPVEKLKDIWSEFRYEYPTLVKTLNTRQKKLRKALTEVLTEKKSKKPDIKAPLPKVGRNAPCPCGSGKKYKKCCLN